MPHSRRTSPGKAAESHAAGQLSRNRLLAALPASDYRRLRPLMTEVPFKPRDVLHAAGERLKSVYFPTDGMCSLVTTMEDGRMVEVATVGSEGMTGVCAVFGGRIPSADAIVHLPGTRCKAMPVEVFAAEIARRGSLYDVASRYANALLGFVMQSAACNGLHGAEQRCARWLLHTHDRVGKNGFPLTQELLAVMLGVRRATVTGIVSEFQRAGLIELGRRRVEIHNRRGLEAMACECYGAIRDQFDRLLS